MARRIRRAQGRSSRTARASVGRVKREWKLGETLGLVLLSGGFIAVFAWALMRDGSHLVPVHASQAKQAAIAAAPAGGQAAGTSAFACGAPVVVDGDTLRCGSVRVRLSSIDAPEMPGHCRRGRACTPGDPLASKANLEALLQSGPVSCEQIDVDQYGRSVALCAAGGIDLSCAQVAGGFAVVRYRELHCT